MDEIVKKGFELGKLNILYELVHEEILSVEFVAEKFGFDEQEFVKEMKDFYLSKKDENPNIQFDELGEISCKILEIDGKLKDAILAIDMLEFRAEEVKDSCCAALLSFLLYHLTHIEAELIEYGNKLDMYWLHLS